VPARPVRHGSAPAAPHAPDPRPPRRFVRDQANATGGYGEGRTDFSESYRSAGNATLGALADSDWLYVHPAGMRQLLKYVNTRRGPPSAAWSLAMPAPHPCCTALYLLPHGMLTACVRAALGALAVSRAGDVHRNGMRGRPACAGYVNCCSPAASPCSGAPGCSCACCGHTACAAC
jgi:hypothetical protein